jgi:hypothetical protein
VERDFHLTGKAFETIEAGAFELAWKWSGRQPVLTVDETTLDSGWT